MNRVIPILSFLVLLMSSCDTNTVYDTHVDIAKEGWGYTDTIWFEVDASEIDEPVDVFAKLRITNDYPKENIYLKIFTEKPSGELREDLVNITLADPYGKWTGNGVGDYLAYKYKLMANTQLDKGTYKFGVLQFMRYEVLPEVHDIGISLEKFATE